MKPPLKQGMSNDFQTPPEAINPLLPYLKKEWTIWECACGKGNLSKRLEELGFKTIATDISSGYNFLEWQPKLSTTTCLYLEGSTYMYNSSTFDCIITNPPYSLKEKFLERCYQLRKPFALLLPLTIFETRKRQELFKKYGVEVIFFDKRINFETPSGNGSGSWFATCWITNGLNIGQQMNFVKLYEKNLIDYIK